MEEEITSQTAWAARVITFMTRCGEALLRPVQLTKVQLSRVPIAINNV
jgi:hypothetical protein